MSHKVEPLKVAHFRFALIAPVIQGLYPDASEAAYYRRVTKDPILRPDGTSFQYSPDTLERWTGLYRKKGMDGLIPGFRKDKGISRSLSADAIGEIYRLREKFPRINGVMIHQMLIQGGFIPSTVSVRAIQRFIKENDLKSARNTSIKDRKAYEMPQFGCMWQADTAYLPYITENGHSRRTFLIMIIDDHSRLIVGGRIFYNDNAYNYQKVLKQAIATYGIPDKLYMDHGSSFENDQLTLILDSLGIVESHAPVRDGAAKGKVERNFRTLRSRWLSNLDVTQIHSIEEFNHLLADYIRRHNTTIHSGTGETPIDRFMRTKDHVRIPKSDEWLNECFTNRITRKVNNDSCITIDGIWYDAPPQFIGMKVDIRYLPNHMENAYILYGDTRFPIRETNKVENSRTKRNNLPAITYSSEGGFS
jgi:transposase InsO family protein